MKRTSIALALCAAAALLATPAAAAEKAGKPKKAFQFVAADQVQFKDAPNLEGVQIAQLWGDMSKDGDWGALVKFKAGTDVGWHTHTGAVNLVILSGDLNIHPEGGEPTDSRAGSYVRDPGKLRHRTVCKEGEDCVFFLHMTKKFDFLKAQEPKTAAAK